MSDPLAIVWAALDRADCDPHGQLHDFRARCPRHEGDNRDALHVSVGADGRAVLWCFAHQCFVEDIVAELGLAMSDLFPPGHHRARRRRLPVARREDFAGDARTVANVLMALERLGADWYLELRADCAHCGSPAALLQVTPRFVVFSCPGDADAEALGFTACTLTQFEEALAGRLEDLEAAR